MQGNKTRNFCSLLFLSGICCSSHCVITKLPETPSGFRENSLVSLSVWITRGVADFVLYANHALAALPWSDVYDRINAIDATTLCWWRVKWENGQLGRTCRLSACMCGRTSKWLFCYWIYWTDACRGTCKAQKDLKPACQRRNHALALMISTSIDSLGLWWILSPLHI